MFNERIAMYLRKPYRIEAIPILDTIRLKQHQVCLFMFFILTACSPEGSRPIEPEDTINEKKLPDIYREGYKRTHYQALSLAITMSDVCPLTSNRINHHIEKHFHKRNLIVDQDQLFGLSIKIMCVLREKNQSSSYRVLVRVKFIENGSPFFRDYGSTFRIASAGISEDSFLDAIDSYVDAALDDYFTANTAAFEGEGDKSDP